MTDPRESHLAALIVELAKIEAGQAEAKKVMKETTDDMKAQIQRLAAEIESGQAELFEAPSEGQPETTCAVCGAACSTMLSISTPGRKPTPPSCLKCMKKATDAVWSGRR